MGEEASSYTHLIHQVDEFYFSALADADELFPISDDNYAGELQLQEVLMSSLVASRRCQQPSRPRPLTNKTVLSALKRVLKEKGESSSSSKAFCKICMDSAPATEMFQNMNCSHVFCRDCLSRHIGAKVRENIAMVQCPEIGCKGLLEPGFCQEIVPREVFERWENALCESMVLGSHRFYCPFKDCSALLVDDCGETVRQSECPNCQRLFCAQCKVGWHSGLSCDEFRRLGPDERGREDLMLMEVAKSKRWKRCPRCKFFVEKTEGCLHITCRCRFQFCYGCGGEWSDTHASCGARL